MAARRMAGKLGLGVAALLASMAASGAGAAPQIVAAVPSNGEVPLTCAGDRCSAEISTVCLQRSRAAPSPGDRYAADAAENAAIAVTGRRADGGEIALDAGNLEFIAARGQVAFRVVLPRRYLDRLGLAGASIRVDRLAMLVPQPEPDDPRPQTAADVDRAKGEMAATGGYWLALEGEPLAVARVASRILNRLPERGSIAADAARTMWSEALAPERELAADERGDAVSRARHRVEYCRAAAFEPGQFPMRRCLARFHDRILQDLNRDYWDALKPQS